MPSSGRFRGFLKRASHSVNNVFKPSDQASTSRTPSPPPRVLPKDPPRRLTPSHEPVSDVLPQPPAQSQSAILFQPAPSPSQPTPTVSPLPTDDSQPAGAESSLALVAKKAGVDAWSGLKAALRLLEKGSDAFPPLKSAVGGFLGVVDIFENAAQNQKNYAEVASNLRAMVDEFKEHPGDHTSSNVSEALKDMASELRKHVEEQQGRSGFKRHVEAGQDVVDVQECYRRVENLRRALQHKVLVKILNNQSGALDKILGNQEDQDMDARLNKLNGALNAMYDSSFSDVVGRRMCTPGTRAAILADIRNWADDPEGPKVYWLNGMAGTGKTTLAYSFCAEMQLDRRLGASFFCSRADTDSRDVSRIVPTIAHQLARLLPSYCEVLIRQIGEDKDIGARNTKTQFEKLIRGPLREVMPSVPEGIVVTIDALDECDRREGAQDILNVLLLNAIDLPLKFFVTCRPEPGLFDVLQSKEERFRSVLHLHDVETSFVQADIKKYLDAELAETSLSLENLGTLAEHAGTLFIYAATAVRYIHPQNRLVNVHQRLDDLLSITSKTRTNKHKNIDDLYTAVLAAPFTDDELNPQEQENIRLILDTTVCAREPMSAATMAKLLGLDSEQDVMHALQHLRSVLHVSQGAGLISALHASFLDFMLDWKRSGDFCCNIAEHNRLLALRCLSTMQRLLRFNICELESSFILDECIPNLAEKVDKAISLELFYACRYWGVHLGFAEDLKDTHSALEDFLSDRLLFWMEVLNLKKCTSPGAQMLDQVHAWLQRLGGANDVLKLALDAGRFVTAFGLSPASRSTPHIYFSMLPFWPKTRPVRQRYWERTQGLIRLDMVGIERRGLLCLAMWDAGSFALCVAISPDGIHIVSGSFDKTVRVWDARSGLLVAGPFKGHIGAVNSVSFSPDGTRIVSGSSDNTIRVWDARNGVLAVGPFEGHTNSVKSVSFSPDGTRIASSSADRTILVWDARSGLLVARLFQGHTSAVRSVSFSPDGTRIVSGSDDKTIRVWDAHSGLLVVAPFEGHTSFVSSVGFSPDGTHIVSGSFDKTIRVWDVRSGFPIARPFEGHIDSVRSVSFSSDGTRIVSGSSDKTIRVWDAHSGLLVVGLFKGHTGPVNSVSFSPDGTCIVSGSDDKTICVWGAHSGVLVAWPFEGHTGSVNSVAFSPDGTLIVSGSHDRTIRVWDVRSGLLAAGPFKGHTDSVNSVSFSPTGNHIVSGSADRTIRVWDVHNGGFVQGLFKGLFERHTDSVNSVTFSSDGTHIASGSTDRTICVWDVHSGLLVAGPFKGHTGPVNSVAFSPDSTHIVSGSGDKTIRVWDAHSGVFVVGPFEGHTNTVNSVSFSPDGTRIVSGSGDYTVRVWATTPLHVHDPGHFNDWIMDKTGMITTQQGQLLLCVPIDFWTGLIWPQNTVCICAKGVLKLDFDYVLLGIEWTKCYQCP